MDDSVINGAGNMYEQMKRNMEHALVRQEEKVQRRMTIKQIKTRDASEKDRADNSRRRAGSVIVDRTDPKPEERKIRNGRNQQTPSEKSQKF